MDDFVEKVVDLNFKLFILQSSQLGRKLRQCRRFTTIAGEKTQVKYGKTLQSSCRKSSSSSSSSDSDSTDVDEDGKCFSFILANFSSSRSFV